MAQSFVFLVRKLAVVLAVLGFVFSPALFFGSAEAAGTTFRLMEDYDPPEVDEVSPMELGVRASTSQEGWVKRVFFYKYAGDDGGHSAHVWSDNGTLLGAQDFVDETESGWQSVALAEPVHIAEGQTFTVSVFGGTFYFAGSAFPVRSSGPLTVIDSYYKNVELPAYPQDTVHTNYAVDFNFSTDSDPETTEPVSGLRVDVYSVKGVDFPAHTPDYVLCSTRNLDSWTSVQSINDDFDADYNGLVAGCSEDFVMVHYSGYLTWPKTETVSLQALADDGFFMTLDGETTIDDWTVKDCSGSIVQHDFIANEPQKLDAWFLELRDGACSRLGFISNDEFVPIPEDAYTKNFASNPWELPATAPSRPLNVSAVVKGVNIKVSWDEPENDGGSPITYYTATARGGGASYKCHSYAVDRNCIIGPVAAGRQYSITVVAYSDEGRLHSEDSDPIKKTINPGMLHASLTAPHLDPLTFGQRLADGTLVGGSSDVPGSFSFKYPNTQPNAGSNVVEVVFTPVDGQTYSSETLNINVQVTKATRALNWSDGTGEPWFYGSSHIAEARVAPSDSKVTYSVLKTSDICSVDEATGELTALRAGDCVIQAKLAASANYFESTSQRTLTVMPVTPTAPTDVQVRLSETSATVTWLAPINDGGTDISSYLVNLRSGDETKTCRVKSDVFTCTIDSLTQGLDYSVEVIAFANNDQLQSLPGIPNLSDSGNGTDSGSEPSPAEAPYVDPRPFEEINPVEDDPAGVAKKTVAAITIVGAVAAAGAAVAGAAGAASAAGGAASGAASGSSSSSSGGAKTESKSSESGGNKKQNEVEEVGHLRHLSRGRLDDASLFGGSGRWGDLLILWSLPLVVALDNPPKRIARWFSRVLPLGAKIFSDGAYLRAMFGSFSALFTIVSLVAGVIGVTQSNGMLVIPSTSVVATIVLIGTFDVLSGFLGAAALSIGLAFVAGIHTPGDVRFLFGVMALGVVPRVISGAFRALRREVGKGLSYHWERLLDYVVAPMLAAWAALQIVGMLPIFAGVALPVEELEKVLPVVVAVGMIIRVTLEEMAGRYFPDRIAYVQVDNLPKPPLVQVLISTILRAATFAFIAAALIGVSWHLLVGAFIFVLPNILALFQNKFPNSRKLYHLMPQGLVNLCVSLWLGQIALIAITGFFHETPDLAKLGFVLLPIPTLVLSILKLFGRHGHEGEPRFYEKPNMGWFYRFGTLIMLFITAELTHTINTTNLL